jgi:uncharacterized protein YndB with AHSA1/START domain
MKTSPAVKKLGGISDEAVFKRTGKTWAEWLAVLDAAGGRRMSHKEIAAWLHANHIASGWWSQMVTVGYEQERGLRQKHQKPEGYQISVSRTLAVPVAKAFRAWTDAKARNRWLGNKDLIIRKATANRSLRLAWGDGKTSVDVNFYPKGRDKCQVVAQHNKLADAKAAARMKKYWAAALDKLRNLLDE